MVAATIESTAADRLSARVAEEWSRGGVTTVTWLNHHTALELRRVGVGTIAPVAYVGIDGLLLLYILGGRSHERTSADAVLPRLLTLLDGARVALVGTRRPSLDRAAAFVADNLLAPGSALVSTRDGFGDLPVGDELDRWLSACRPNVVIVGLGAGLQERWALDVAAKLPSGLVVTCGAFLDQVYQPGYYPSWAYPLKLNWAVRLARNPRRMWRRYTIEALHAIRNRRSLRLEIECLAGFRTYRAAVNGHAHGER